MCASDTFVSPCTYHIYKNNYLLYIIKIVWVTISAERWHDIIMIEHNSIRVLFCCFLCSLLNCFRLSHACHTCFIFFSFLRTVFSKVSDSYTFHSFSTQITLRFSLESEDVWTAFTLPSYRYSSFTLRTYNVPSEAYLLPIPKEHKLCSLPKWEENGTW